jgi:hypothetical protein
MHTHTHTRTHNGARYRARAVGEQAPALPNVLQRHGMPSLPWDTAAAPLPHGGGNAAGGHLIENADAEGLLCELAKLRLFLARRKIGKARQLRLRTSVRAVGYDPTKKNWREDAEGARWSLRALPRARVGRHSAWTLG